MKRVWIDRRVVRQNRPPNFFLRLSQFFIHDAFLRVCLDRCGKQFQRFVRSTLKIKVNAVSIDSENFTFLVFLILLYPHLMFASSYYFIHQSRKREKFQATICPSRLKSMYCLVYLEIIPTSCPVNVVAVFLRR